MRDRGVVAPPTDTHVADRLAELRRAHGFCDAHCGCPVCLHQRQFNDCLRRVLAF
jgi:hypothetical protein